MQLTLWPIRWRRKQPVEVAPRSKRAEARPKAIARPELVASVTDPDDPAWNALPMAERYDAMSREMRRRHGVRVRKWRTSMSGVAWQVTYRDGSVSKLIETPRPKGPMSAAVFLHEIGHHAIGFGVYRPRCLEEYHAWRFSLEQMRAWKLNVTPAVEHRMHESLHWAIDKASRRGLKRLPEELAPFVRAPGPRRAVSSSGRAG